MHRWITAFAVLTLLAAARAAPVCENRAGEPVRCEAKDAMPLGWKLPAAERARHPLPPTDTRLATDAVLLVALLLALVALLPEFDGREDADWIEKDPKKRT
jgi:hypothetical protein